MKKESATHLVKAQRALGRVVVVAYNTLQVGALELFAVVAVDVVAQLRCVNKGKASLNWRAKLTSSLALSSAREPDSSPAHFFLLALLDAPVCSCCASSSLTGSSFTPLTNGAKTIFSSFSFGTTKTSFLCAYVL